MCWRRHCTALLELQKLADKAEASGSSKLDALLAYLRTIGVHDGGDTRVVIFSERIPTLKWLATELTTQLKLKEKPDGSVPQLEVLHATLNDDDIQRIVEDFALERAPVRILLTSDMASEGINLHRQCHHMVHFDLPWSFIRIQQRNGRIDRYLQTSEPQIAALALTSPDPDIASDLKVVTKLLQKEHAANQALGDAGALLDLHDAQVEEDTVMKALADGKDLDEIVGDVTRPTDPVATAHPFSWMLAAGAQHDQDRQPVTASPATLFDDDDNYLTEALQQLHPNQRELHLERDTDTDLLAFDTPFDLLARFRDLPDTYLRDRKVNERVRLSANLRFAEQRLARARAEGTTLWPDVHFLAPLHPVLDWVASRCQAALGRNRAPGAEVEEPVFLTQAVWSSASGRPAVGVWGAISGLPDRPRVSDLQSAIAGAGVAENAINPSTSHIDLAALQRLVPVAIDAATADLEIRRADLEAELQERLDRRERQLVDWREHALSVADAMGTRSKGRRGFIDRAGTEMAGLIAGQRPTGRPFVRVVGVIVPRAPIGRGH